MKEGDAASVAVDADEEVPHEWIACPSSPEREKFCKDVSNEITAETAEHPNDWEFTPINSTRRWKNVLMYKHLGECVNPKKSSEFDKLKLIAIAKILWHHPAKKKGEKRSAEQATAPDVALEGGAGGTQQQREPKFTGNEYVRLAHVIVSDACRTATSAMMGGLDRSQLDAGARDPFVVYADNFNDGGTVFKHIDRDDDKISMLDPNTHPHHRGKVTLKGKWSELRTQMTLAWGRYTSTGNSEGGDHKFVEACYGKAPLYYIYKLFGDQPSFQPLLRTVPEGCRAEVGMGDNASVSAWHSPKRKRHKGPHQDLGDAMNGGVD